MTKIQVIVPKLVMVFLLLGQVPLALATTVTYSKYQISFSPNHTANSDCVQPLPTLYFSSAKTTSQSPPVLSIDRPAVYQSITVKRRDLSNPQLIRFSDEVRMLGLTSAIMLQGTTDRASLRSHGQWSYDQGRCAGTFAMVRLSTRR